MGFSSKLAFYKVLVIKIIAGEVEAVPSRILLPRAPIPSPISSPLFAFHALRHFARSATGAGGRAYRDLATTIGTEVTVQFLHDISGF